MAEKERGFAAMDQQKQREIARKGGQAAHQRGTAHEFTPEEAAKAGRKGGQCVSRDREHMARIGRKGGLASHSRDEAGNPPVNPNGAREELREPVMPTVHLSLDEPREEADLDSVEMLAEGRMGNENATPAENHGGHGYDSYEQEKSPQMS